MGKKHKHPEHENHERWLVSYADFITLLFATFTALYAIATADLAKVNKMTATAEAISEGFQEQSIMSGIKTILQGKSPPTDNPNPLSKKQGEGSGLLGKHDSLVTMHGVKPPEMKIPSLQDMQSTMAMINADLQSAAGVQMTQESNGVHITFDSQLLFASGSASLTPHAMRALAALGHLLQPLTREAYQVHIEGHTDNQPIDSLLFPSNWELSTARACSVVRSLIQLCRLPANQLAAAGYADTRPKASNETETGRQKNRRIDIWINGLKVPDDKTLDQQSIRRASQSAEPLFHPLAERLSASRPQVSLRNATLKSGLTNKPSAAITQAAALQPVPDMKPVVPHPLNNTTNHVSDTDKPSTTGGDASSHPTPASPAMDGFVPPRYAKVVGGA